MSTSFIIYRIIGNSLPPRHAENDSFTLLKYILENEPELKNCKKRWILNKIIHPEVERKCIDLIKSYKQEYEVISFDLKEYRNCFLDASGMPNQHNPLFQEKNNTSDHDKQLSLEWTLRHKSQCLININKARNRAIELGRKDAEWVLPLDGWCYFSKEGWESFRSTISKKNETLYGIIPLERISKNSFLLNTTSPPKAEDEPQIAFRHDAPDRFNEHLRYGNRNKADLLTQLGVPGIWNNWKPAPWDSTPTIKATNKHKFAHCGWCFRLASETSQQIEKNNASRYKARFQGVENTLLQIDKNVIRSKPYKKQMIFHLQDIHVNINLQETLIELQSLAEIQYKKTIRKITDKTLIAPSGLKNDYISPSRYSHMAGGKQINMDGISNRHAIIGSKESYQYDRTSLSEFINQLTILTIAGIKFNHKNYLNKATESLVTWFIDPSSKMNPHAKFAQGDPNNPKQSKPFGLIDFRDLWLVPYLCNTLQAHGALSNQNYRDIQLWCKSFLKYLNQSQQGKQGYLQSNNIGTWVHLLKLSLALFIGRDKLAAKLISESSLRLVSQHSTLGMQTDELSRTRPLHYSLFNLTAWTLLSNVTRSTSLDLWNYKGKNDESLCRMIRFIQLNMSSFPEYSREENHFKRWMNALLFLIPKTAADFSILEPPVQQTWKDDPNNGLPPQWHHLLGKL